MKITFVNFIDGDARILVDEFPFVTFVVKMKKNLSKQDVLDSVVEDIGKMKEDDSEKIFLDLDLKSLEGTELG